VIGSLRGTVLERSATGEAIVEVGGVGYRVLVPLTALQSLIPGEATFVFTHLHVRDDAMVLYGFPSREQRDTFEVLIGANGVGPKLALAICSVHSPGALRRALIDDDVDALTLVPGVGKRTAQRLLLELKARLEMPGLTAGDAEPATVTTRVQVREALAGLGYEPDEVRDALATLPDDGPVEELLRDALRRLAVSRV
jgi:Holliday junction DNA helicase RuvA